MPPSLSRRVQELAAEGTPFVTATVVRAQAPTSVEAGAVAVVHADGTIEGFVGGDCTEHSVRAYALKVLETGEPLLLRVLPFSDEDGAPPDDVQPGAVTVQNPCLSGGAVELFLEPSLPAPRVLVVGETPIAGALLRIGPELDLDVLTAAGAALEPAASDLAVIVAAHGRDELRWLRLALEAGVPYVALVASPRRGDGVLAELRGDGLPDELLARVDVPAGLDIGARTPGEIAVSIFARVVELRRGGTVAPPAATRAIAAQAIDPVCGMTVAASASTLSLEHDGETVYFCCEGCRAAFERDHAGVSD